MFEDLMTMGSGVVLLIVTFLAFWTALPHPDGRPQRFIGTAMEPIIAVAVTAGVVMGIGLIIAGASSFAVAK